MAVVDVFCPYCNDKNVVKNGKSIVGEQSNQRWLWLALNHHHSEVLAYTFGDRNNAAFKQLKQCLSSFPERGYVNHLKFKVTYYTL